MGWSKSEEVTPLIHAIARSSLARDEQREIFAVFVSVLEDLDFDVWDELEDADIDFDYVMKQKGLIGKEEAEVVMVEVSKTDLDALREKASRYDDLCE